MNRMLQFEPLDCNKCRYRERQFVPIEHDLITISQSGKVQIAKNAPAAEIKTYLGHCNGNSARDMHGMDTSPILTLIRFEEAAEDVVVEEHQNHLRGSTTNDEWSQLWPILECANATNMDLGFESKIRHQRSPCQSLESETTNINGSVKTICRKLSYDIHLQEKRITLSNHFHKVDGNAKAMARMVTCGLSLKIIKEIVGEILILLKNHSPATESAVMESILPVPHPKTIVCSILDCIENKSSMELAQYRKYLAEIEWDISKQRDPTTKKPNGLEINYINLSETIVNLSDTRQKLQKMDYLISLIAAVEDSKGNPKVCESTPGPGTGMNDGREIPENQICHEWKKQLREVNIRISELKGRCRQHNLSIEGLQKRVKGILNIVSILRAERENTQMRQTQKRRQETLDYQTSMLGKQEIIVAQTKRDNTVMKVIALLTAFFLPGTFIATVFSVPVFQWDQENPIGPHFKVYWYFTIPITTVLVVGFSVWFLKMRYDDDREERKRNEKELLEDPEKVANLRGSESF